MCDAQGVVCIRDYELYILRYYVVFGIIPWEERSETQEQRCLCSGDTLFETWTSQKWKPSQPQEFAFWKTPCLCLNIVAWVVGTEWVCGVGSRLLGRYDDMNYLRILLIPRRDLEDILAWARLVLSSVGFAGSKDGFHVSSFFVNISFFTVLDHNYGQIVELWAAMYEKAY